MGLYRVDAMTALIRTQLKESSDTILTDAIILQAINDGQKEVASRAFCIEHEDTVTTVAGNRLVPFSGHSVSRVMCFLQYVTTASPSVNGDDGSTDGANFGFGGFIYPLFGIDGWGRYYKDFVRMSLNVPKGAIIESAYLTFTARAASSSGSGNILVNVYANNIDNAIAPTSDTTFNALVKTTATVPWTITAWTGDVAYTTPDIKNIVQEVVDRPNWASGNAFMPLLYSGTYYGSHQERGAYGFELGSKYAVLTVTYSFSTIGLLKIFPTIAGYANISGNAPQYWFQWGNYIVIEPVPDAAYSLTLSISDYPAAVLTLDTEYPSSLPDEFHPCIVDFACYVLSLKLHNWKQAGEYYNRYIVNLKKRKQEYIERKAEKRLIHTQPNVGG